MYFFFTTVNNAYLIFKSNEFCTPYFFTYLINSSTSTTSLYYIIYYSYIFLFSFITLLGVKWVVRRRINNLLIKCVKLKVKNFNTQLVLMFTQATSLFHIYTRLFEICSSNIYLANCHTGLSTFFSMPLLKYSMYSALSFLFFCVHTVVIFAASSDV